MTTSATIWHFTGKHLSGETDEAGTPIADILSGNFVTATSDRTAALAAITATYAHVAGEARITSLEPLHSPWAEKMAPRYVKRGGTKDCPLLGN